MRNREKGLFSLFTVSIATYSQKSDCSNIVFVAFNQFECIMKTKIITKTQLRWNELSVFFVQKYTWNFNFFVEERWGDFENLRPTFSVPRKANMLHLILSINYEITVNGRDFFSINGQILRIGVTADAQHLVRRGYMS